MELHGWDEAAYFSLERKERARKVGALIVNRALSAMRDYDRAKMREEQRTKNKGRT